MMIQLKSSLLVLFLSFLLKFHFTKGKYVPPSTPKIIIVGEGTFDRHKHQYSLAENSSIRFSCNPQNRYRVKESYYYPPQETIRYAQPYNSITCRSSSYYTNNITLNGASISYGPVYVPIVEYFVCIDFQYKILCALNMFHSRKNAYNALDRGEDLYLLNGEQAYVLCYIKLECQIFEKREHTGIVRPDVMHDRLLYIHCDSNLVMGYHTSDYVVKDGSYWKEILSYSRRNKEFKIYCLAPSLSQDHNPFKYKGVGFYQARCFNSTILYFMYDEMNVVAQRSIYGDSVGRIDRAFTTNFFCHDKFPYQRNNYKSIAVGYEYCTNLQEAFHPIFCQPSVFCDHRNGKSCYIGSADYGFTYMPKKMYDVANMVIIEGTVTVYCHDISFIRDSRASFRVVNGTLFYPVYLFINDNGDITNEGIFCHPNDEQVVLCNMNESKCKLDTGEVFKNMDALSVNIYQEHVLTTKDGFYVCDSRINEQFDLQSLEDVLYDDSHFYTKFLYAHFESQEDITVYCRRFDSICDLSNPDVPCYVDDPNTNIDIPTPENSSDCPDSVIFNIIYKITATGKEEVAQSKPTTYRCRDKDLTVTRDALLVHGSRLVVSHDNKFYQLTHELQFCDHGELKLQPVYCKIDLPWVDAMLEDRIDYYYLEHGQVGVFHCNDDKDEVYLCYSVKLKYGSFDYDSKTHKFYNLLDSIFCPKQTRNIHIYCAISPNRNHTIPTIQLREGDAVELNEEKILTYYDPNENKMMKDTFQSGATITCTYPFIKMARSFDPRSEYYSIEFVSRNEICFDIAYSEDKSFVVKCCTYSFMEISGKQVVKDNGFALIECPTPLKVYNWYDSYKDTPLVLLKEQEILLCWRRHYQAIHSDYIYQESASGFLTTYYKLSEKCPNNDNFALCELEKIQIVNGDYYLKEGQVFNFGCSVPTTTQSTVVYVSASDKYEEAIPIDSYVVCNPKLATYVPSSSIRKKPGEESSAIFYSLIAKHTCDDEVHNVYCEFITEICNDNENECHMLFNEEVYLGLIDNPEFTTYDIYIDGKLTRRHKYSKFECTQYFIPASDLTWRQDVFSSVLVPYNLITQRSYYCVVLPSCINGLYGNCYLRDNTYAVVDCTQYATIVQYGPVKVYKDVIKLSDYNHNIVCKSDMNMYHTGLRYSIANIEYALLAESISCGSQTFEIYCEIFERLLLNDVTIYLKNQQTRYVYCNDVAEFYVWELDATSPQPLLGNRFDVTCNSNYLKFVSVSYISHYNNLSYVQMMKPNYCLSDSISSIHCLSYVEKVTSQPTNEFFLEFTNADVSCHLGPDNSKLAEQYHYTILRNGTVEPSITYFNTEKLFSCTDHYVTFAPQYMKMKEDRRYVTALSLTCDGNPLSVYCPVISTCIMKTDSSCYLNNRDRASIECTNAFVVNTINSDGSLSVTQQSETASVVCISTTDLKELVDISPSNIVRMPTGLKYYAVKPGRCNVGDIEDVFVLCNVFPTCVVNNEECFLSSIYEYGIYENAVSVKVYTYAEEGVTFQYESNNVVVYCHDTMIFNDMQTSYYERKNDRYYYLAASNSNGGDVYCPLYNTVVMLDEPLYLRNGDRVLIQVTPPIELNIHSIPPQIITISKYIYDCLPLHLKYISAEFQVEHDDLTYAVIVAPRLHVGGVYCEIFHTCYSDFVTNRCYLSPNSKVNGCLRAVTVNEYSSTGHMTTSNILGDAVNQTIIRCDLDKIKHAPFTQLVKFNNILYAHSFTVEYCSSEETIPIYCSLDANYILGEEDTYFLKSSERLLARCRDPIRRLPYYATLTDESEIATEQISYVICQSPDYTSVPDISLIKNKDDVMYVQILQSTTCIPINDTDSSQVQVYCELKSPCENITTDCWLPPMSSAYVGCDNQSINFQKFEFTDLMQTPKTSFYNSNISIACDSDAFYYIESNYLISHESSIDDQEHIYIQLTNGPVDPIPSSSGCNGKVYCQSPEAIVISGNIRVYKAPIGQGFNFSTSVVDMCDPIIAREYTIGKEGYIQRTITGGTLYKCNQAKLLNFPATQFLSIDDKFYIQPFSDTKCSTLDGVQFLCEMALPSIYPSTNSTFTYVSMGTVVKISGSSEWYYNNWYDKRATLFNGDTMFCPHNILFKLMRPPIMKYQGAFYVAFLTERVSQHKVACEYVPDCILGKDNDCNLRMHQSAVIDCGQNFTNTMYVLNDLFSNTMLTIWSQDLGIITCAERVKRASSLIIDKVTISENSEEYSAYVLLRDFNCDPTATNKYRVTCEYIAEAPSDNRTTPYIM